MILGLEKDLQYLENKYHRTDEPYNAYHRFGYHGGEYDAATGFDDDEMARHLADLASMLKQKAHPVAKATMFGYLLDHARIDVNAHDWYIGFYNWGRPLWRFTCTPWNDAAFAEIPEVSEKIHAFDVSGAVAIWPDFDHVIPNWDALLSLGYPGLLARVRKYHAEWTEKGISPEQDAFFRGVELSYEAVLRLLDRYIAYAQSKSDEKSDLQCTCLRHLREGAPTNLYEALQAMYLFFLLCECLDNYQTRSLGNGIDSTLLPFYRNDIASGAFSAEQEKAFLAYFLLQFAAIDNYWGHPMYMGGTNADGSTKYNEVSYLILDLYEELRIYNPKVQLKIAENTPKEFRYRVYDLIRKGVSGFVFCCEPGMQKAVMAYGATPEEARNYEISGCYETRIRSDESSTGTGYINAAKAVELVLHNGQDVKTGLQIGPKTGEVAEFSTFEDFYFAFLQQWAYLIHETVRISNHFDPLLAVINPSNIYSATIERALKRGVDGYAHGVKFNNSSILNCGFASAVDSVMAVKKLCFDTKTVSLAELKKALDADWAGYEALRAQAKKLPYKYGNAEPETDRIATAMADYFSHTANGIPNGRGGVYKAIMHSAMMFIWQGEKTAALPDGHGAGEELSKNATPVVGMDRNGVTATIRSALALHPYNYHESFNVDLMLHPSAVAGADGLAAMDALLMTYCKKDGMSMQFNIFNAETLRDAQAHPEKYRTLQVRVCGWNVLWNNLSKKEQDSYILRAENIRD